MSHVEAAAQRGEAPALLPTARGSVTPSTAAPDPRTTGRPPPLAARPAARRGLIAALLLAAGPAAAGPDWERHSSPAGDLLEARWSAPNGERFTLEATLPAGTFEAAAILSDDPAARAARAERVATRLRAWAKREGRRLEVSVGPGGVRVRGPKKQLAAAEAERDALTQAALAEDFRRLRRNGRVGYDVGGIALAAAPKLRAVTDGFGSLLEARELAERALLFVQRIPYATAAHDSFRTPSAVLRDHAGDCDEKVALFAALLRAHEPTLPIAVITMPGHAFVGIDLAPHGDEQNVLVGGRLWLVAEPVGPAIQPLGRISERSAAALRDDTFDLTLVPPSR